MPTEPSPATPTNASVPHGQAIPNAQHLPQHAHARIPPHQPPHPRYPQHAQPLLQQPSGLPLPHQTQHLPQRQQYAPLSSGRNISQMQQPHLTQTPHQLQQQQPRQHPRSNLNHQQPPQQQYYVNHAYAGLNPYSQVPQYGINPNYVFPQTPYAYNGMQPQPGAQQPASHNPRAQRPYPRNVTSQGPQRQPPSRVTVPARGKRILPIVDPDTNEEVKVDTLETKSASRSTVPAAPPAAVKIPARTSRPLELVSDPADTSSKSGPDSAKALHASEVVKPKGAEVNQVLKEAAENKAQQVEKPLVAAMSSDVAVPVSAKADEGDVVQDVTPVSVPHTSRDSAPSTRGGPNANGAPTGLVARDLEQVESPLSSAPLDSRAEIDVEKEKEARLAEVTPNSPVASISSAASPVSTMKSDGAQAVSNVPNIASEGEAQRSDVSHANEAATNGTSEVSKAAESAPTASKPDIVSADSSVMGKKEVSSSTVTSVDTESSSQATPRRERPIFKEGERRVYAPNFILSMRSSADPKRVEEYEVALSSTNILKSGETPTGRDGDLRGSRVMKGNLGNTGPLSADPRGKRAFPAQAGPGYIGPRGGPPGMIGGGVGSYDAFDLRSARSQNPPPAPRAQPTHGRGNQDPRGSRGRLDGPTRGGHGPIDPFLILPPPVEKLKRSEHGWKRDKESDDEITSKVKQIRSLLNKLTLEKFDKILKQIIDINISSYEILEGVVREVFEKALFEPKFSGMYAELCVRLDVATKDMLQKANIIDSSGKPIFFKKILLNHCRLEFTRFAASSEAPEGASDEEDKESGDDGSKDGKNKEPKVLTPEEKAAKERLDKEKAAIRARKAKQRMLANGRFIGELFLQDLIKEQVIHVQCIQKLLKIGIEKREEDVLEALCKLLSKTGAKLSQNVRAIQHIDNYFQPLQVMSRDHTLPARVRFMLQDLIDQRSNGWKVRREEAGAKTIAEIHKDIEKEELAKAEAQAAARDRRGRGGGGMHHRDRGPQNFSPRVAMTMASRKSTGSSISRSTAILEKHGNRGPSTAASNLQGMRLGPGGSKASSVSSGSGKPSLRPGGSRYGSFSALSSESRDSSLAQSGDARRGAAKKFQSSSRRSVSVKPETVEVKPKLMDPEKLKRKSMSIIEEYWSIMDLGEAKECVIQEVQTPNFPKFVEEAIRASLTTKVENREKSVSLFVGLIGETIPGVLFTNALPTVMAELPDIEMDDPRASEFLAKYIGALAASGKLTTEKNLSYGLDFLKQAMVGITDAKAAVKLSVHILASLYKHLSSSIPDEDQRKKAVKKALEILDMDLASKMSSWNPMRGVATLESMLKDLGIMFVLPLLPVELRLKEAFQGQATKDDVSKIFLSSGLAEEELRSAAFVQMVVRVSFDWLFSDPPTSVKDAFCSVVGGPLVQCFGGEVPRDVQMAALLETQSFIVEKLDTLPPHKEGDYDRPGSIAFDSLYFADIVDEDSCLGWKEDTDLSIKVGGKDKMIMQTSPFFGWLATAEEE